MPPRGEHRREVAEKVILRELARLAETNAGTLPRGYANRIVEMLRAEGVGIRRQDALRLVGEYADFLQTPGKVAQRAPERFAPARSAAAKAAKRQAALDVVALMRREGLSLTQAVRRHNRKWPDAKVSPASVTRLVPRALEKRGATWQPTRYDRYARTTDALTTEGVKPVTVRDSRTASLITRHHVVVRAYLENRADASVLRPFRGKHFRAGKRTYVLETDLDALHRIGLGEDLENLIIGSGQEIAA